MGDHDMPSSWLEHWREAEPVRTYLWTVAAAVLFGGVSTGLLREDYALAIGGVAAAVLMVGGTHLARRDAYAPLTVERLLDEQHRTSYRRGVEAATTALEQVHRSPDVVAAETRELAVVAGSTQPRHALGRCRYVESGRRCSLAMHPETIGHRLEEARPRE